MTVWKLTTFLSPLMLVLSAQRISRPIINLLVARFSATKCQAAEVQTAAGCVSITNHEAPRSEELIPLPPSLNLTSLLSCLPFFFPPSLPPSPPHSLPHSLPPQAIAVLTATYPLGHLGYGWLNQLRPLLPAFLKVCTDTKLSDWLID